MSIFDWILEYREVLIPVTVALFPVLGVPLAIVAKAHGVASAVRQITKSVIEASDDVIPTKGFERVVLDDRLGTIVDDRTKKLVSDLISKTLVSRVGQVNS